MSNYIPAATVILLRDEPEFQALMIERHADMGFAGGALVFPGGRLEESDSDPEWADHCTGLDAAPREQWAGRIGAIREAFEESGILLARKTGDDNFVNDDFARNLSDQRKAVEDDARLFLDMVKQESLSLAGDALHLFARWRPPKEATHKRFDTWFFAAATPPGQSAREDGNEATEAIWTSPNAAIASLEAGTRKMIFPTKRNVELLGVSKCAEEVLQFASKREIRAIEPFIVDKEGKKFVTIPADLGYPITEEPIETAFRL